MRYIPAFGAAAFALTAAAAAMAQPASPAGPAANAPAGAPPAADEPTPSTTAPPSTTPPSAAPSAEANAANTAAIVPGLTVKDKTGATIGQVTSVKPDASGKQVATIQMGADSFSVDTSALAVQDGAATVNATQSEIRQMMQSSAHK
jgi:hypothetical protein